MTDRLLVIGAGFLGKTVFQTATKIGLKSFCTNMKNGQFNLDIRDLGMIEKIIDLTKPNSIINCAAVTDVDKIELDSKYANQVNSQGAKNIAKLAKKNKIKFVHISTDGIFDGTKRLYSESSIPNPVNEYAKSKKLGEDLVLEANENSIIIRTNFYGFNDENKFLFNWILGNLKQNQKFTAFSDVIFNPLEIRNLSQIILDILKTDFQGIIHMTGHEIFSKYQFACKIAKILNYDISLIDSGSIIQSTLIANRPLNTSLSNKLLKSLLDPKILSLEMWLNEKFLEQSKEKMHKKNSE